MKDTDTGGAPPTRLLEIEVLDEYGAPVRLGNLWLDQVAILAFVRHFG